MRIAATVAFEDILSTTYGIVLLSKHFVTLMMIFIVAWVSFVLSTKLALFAPKPNTILTLFHLFYHLVLGGKLFQKVPEKGRMVLKPYLDRAFAADSITPTVFGVTLAPLLMAARDLLEWNLPHRRKLGEYKPVPGSPVPENIYALFALVCFQSISGKKYLAAH